MMVWKCMSTWMYCLGSGVVPASDPKDLFMERVTM
jgi:hypothetical protein